MVAKHLGILLFSNESPPPSLIDVLPRIAPRPVLLIWATDSRNREAINTLYQQLIGPSATSWPLSDVGHIKGLQTRPEEYRRRVLDFFDSALLDAPPVAGTGA